MIYPEIYIPRELKELFVIQPKLVSVPKEPLPPTVPTEPQKIVESPKEVFYLIILSILSLIFISFLFELWTRMTTSEIKLYLIFSTVFFLFFALRISYITKRKKNRRLDYESDMRIYELELMDLKKKVDQYNKDLIKYEEEKEKIKKMNDLALSKNEIENYRNRAIRSFSSKKYYHLKEVSYNEIQRKGASERYFETYLKNNELFSVKTDIKILNSSGLFFYPDFILIIRKSGIHIDLEIDEPYICNNGKPIHYENNSYSSDSDRNGFFINEGWIVMRFAEEQIFKSPDVCLKYIIQVINNLNELNSDDIEFPFEHQVPKWTKDQAHSWAFKRYRHSYVPAQYHSLIDSNNWNEEDENELQKKSELYISLKNLLGRDRDLPF